MAAAGAGAASAPVWPYIVAGIGSAVGSIGSALGSMSGGSTTRRVRANKYGGEAHRQSIATHWNETMRMAEKHGIHPLAALGVNPGTGPRAVPSGSGGPSATEKMAAMSQAIGKTLRTPYEMKMARYSLQQEAEKLRGMRLQNEITQRQVSQVDTLSGPPGSGISEETLASPMQGVVPGSIPEVQMIVKPGGYIDFIPSRDVQDYYSESLIENSVFQAKKYWRKFTDFVDTKRNLFDPKLQRELRDKLDDLANHAPPGRGYYYTYDATIGMPRIVQRRGHEVLVMGGQTPRYVRRIQR
jgi:hypothetical protein